MMAAAHKADTESSGESVAAESAGTQPPEETGLPQPPRFSSYVLLNLAVWGFLALQALLLSSLMGSARMVVLLSLLLALGFMAVSIFDYVYLRSTRKGKVGS